MRSNAVPQKVFLPLLLLLAVVLLAYSNTFSASFQIDDFHQIVDNTYVRDLQNIPGFFIDPGMENTTPDYYRPVTFASFAVNYAVSGYKVWGWHAFNMLLHFLNAFLVYMIVKAVYKGEGRDAGDAVPLIAAVLFAVHPIQTGAVTYISGRAVLMASFFSLFSFLCFRAYRASGGLVYAVGAVGAFLLGMLSKEMAVGTIGIMLAYDAVYTTPGRGGIRGFARVHAIYGALSAVLVIYLYYRSLLLGVLTMPRPQFGMSEYLLSEAKAFFLYCRLMALPMNQDSDYGIPVTAAVDWKVVLSVLSILGAVACLYRTRRKNPAASFFGLWFLIALMPEATLTAIKDIVQEYRLYLPSAGLIAYASIWGAGLVVRQRFKRLALVFVVVLFGILTFCRNGVWETQASLRADALRKSGCPGEAHLKLGAVLYREGRFPEAAAEFARSLESQGCVSASKESFDSLGRYLASTGDHETAVRMFRKAAELEPGAESYMRLGYECYASKRYQDALEALQNAARVSPALPKARLLLAKTYHMLGRSKDALREIDLAAR